MSYTVLARKWRPQNFNQLIGQEHVQRAIVNAIEQDRLHHAYLFTGTRGVGKTTIARIFSKCLNCETGVTANPCGECAVCQEIEQGHFVDLLEIDAASRTKVEDTREILDNVQYRPSRGRYKVYLIDEVHMLSNSSFNALLKTLEEPPPHVIFLLATTDPQKLPVTVLSRCLQFHLKRMAPEQIVEHLAHILSQESINYDDNSLELIARAADGSMRDSLSLLDQAIAFGAGQLQYKDVADMLGAVDQQFVAEYVTALSEHNPEAILEITSRMAEFAPDYQAVLAEIISCLHQLAVAQLVGEESLADTRLQSLLQNLSPEDIQLFYQLAIHARKDLPLSPDARQGFEMALLRMLAFRPAAVSGTSSGSKNSVRSNVTTPTNGMPDNTAKQAKVEAQKKNTQVAPKPVEPSPSEASANMELSKQVLSETVGDKSTPVETIKTKNDNIMEATPAKTPEEKPLGNKVEAPRAKASESVENNLNADIMNASSAKLEQQSEPAVEKTLTAPVVIDDLTQLTDANVWHDFIQQLELTGSIFQVLNNSRVLNINEDKLTLALLPSVEHFCTEAALEKIHEALGFHLKQSVKVLTELGQEDMLTPRMISEQRYQQRLEHILDEFKKNPKVNDLLTTFSGQITCEDIVVAEKTSIH